MGTSPVAKVYDQQLKITTCQHATFPIGKDRYIKANIGLIIIFNDRKDPIGARHWIEPENENVIKLFCPFCGAIDTDCVHYGEGLMTISDFRLLAIAQKFEWENYDEEAPWWDLTSLAKHRLMDWSLKMDCEVP